MKNFIASLLLLPVFALSQLPNGGMENYTFTPNDTVPTDWATESVWTTALGQNSNAFAGNYSFTINTWYHYSPGMMLNGFPSNGLSNFLSSWIYAGTPVSYKPAQLNGYYMYTDTVWGDSAVVQVLLKKWNTTMNKIDSVAYGIKKLRAASSWTPFTLNMNDLMPGITPDSIIVFFMTFDYPAGTQPICNDPLCRYLSIDELSLSGTLGIGAVTDGKSHKVIYSDNNLIINSESQEIELCRLFSVDGKLLKEFRIGYGTNAVPISDLENGIYLLNISGKHKNTFRFAKM